MESRSGPAPGAARALGRAADGEAVPSRRDHDAQRGGRLRWPSARATPSTSSSSAPAPAAIRPPSARPSWASGSPSSTRPSSAARASIAAASRPRRCSSRRSSRAHPAREGLRDRRQRRGRPSTTPRWRSGATQVVDAAVEGPQDPGQEEQGERIAGPRQAPGRQEGARRDSSARTASRGGRRAAARGDRRDPRHRVAGQVPARARARRRADHHHGRLLTRGHAAQSIVVVGGGAVGVEFASMFHDVGVEVTCSSTCPRSCRSRTAR